MDSVEQYISSFDPSVQKTLSDIRQIIKENVPLAVEKLSWGAPTYLYNGFLVQFAAYKKHIGFYCSPQAIQHFSKQLSTFQTNKKNTIQFSYKQDIPYQLIKDIVLYRLKENQKDAD